MKFAFAFGADAVYAGAPHFSMRARENNFSLEEFADAVKFAHKLGKKIYAAVNIFPRNAQLSAAKKILQKIAAAKPDAFIISDEGIFDFCRENFPEIPRHISVQRNLMNSESVKFWAKNGAKRIILSRELNLKEIAEIARANPKTEFEIFVHGAICVSHSGRCLISNFLTGRDANRGACAQSCRWNWKIFERAENFAPKNLKNREFFVEESERRGEFLPILENENGTFLFSSRDLCALNLLPEILKSGVKSLKIEGRNKTVFYAAIVARVYRSALDAISAGKKFDGKLPKKILEKLFAEIFSTGNRGFFEGFLRKFPGAESIEYFSRAPFLTHDFVGIVRGKNLTARSTNLKNKNNAKNFIEIEPKNKITAGDKIEFCFPKFTDDFKISAKIFDENWEEISEISGGAKNCFLQIPAEFAGKFNGEIFCVLRRRRKSKSESAQS